MTKNLMFYPYIILTCILIIVLIFVYTLNLKLNYAQQTIKDLEQENRIFERQIEINNQDLLKRNEEIENAEKRANSLQEKANQINDSCLHATVNNDFAKLLYDENK